MLILTFKVSENCLNEKIHDYNYTSERREFKLVFRRARHHPDSLHPSGTVQSYGSSTQVPRTLLNRKINNKYHLSSFRFKTITFI